jgi:hypothetical protein
MSSFANLRAFLILVLCLATLFDSLIFDNAAGVVLDLSTDVVVVLDFGLNAWSSRYWRGNKYNILFDTALILLLSAYSVVDLYYGDDPALDDLEALLVGARFFTRFAYSCGQLFKRWYCCKPSHVRIVALSEDPLFCISDLEDGPVWDHLKNAHSRICRALELEEACTVAGRFSNPSLSALCSVVGASQSCPHVTWVLTSSGMVWGFLRACDWGSLSCEASPALQIVRVENNQYDLLSRPRISLVQSTGDVLSVVTDSAVYKFTDDLRVLEVQPVGEQVQLYTVEHVDVLSYARADDIVEYLTSI